MSLMCTLGSIESYLSSSDEVELLPSSYQHLAPSGVIFAEIIIITRDLFIGNM